MRKRKKYQ